MGLRQTRADRVPTEGAVHGHADHLVKTDSEPREAREGYLRLSSLQNVDSSWYVKIPKGQIICNDALFVETKKRCIYGLASLHISNKLCNRRHGPSVFT